MPRLTARFVDTVTRPGKYHDAGGHGLSLRVEPGGAKNWVWRGTIRNPTGGPGRRVDRGLGPVGVVTLREARESALDFRRAAFRGVDLGRRERERERPDTPTLRECAEATIEAHRPTWKPGSRSEEHWRSSLEHYILGTLGDRPIDQIASGDLLAIIGPLWGEKREAARKLLARIRAVVRWALAAGHIAADPLPPVIAALPKNGHQVQHVAALPAERVGDAIRAVRTSGAWWATKSCFEIIALCGVRSGEARGAQWSEVQTAEAVWTVPAERTKTSQMQRIPLSPRALEVLRDAHERTGGTGLIFPSPTGRALTSETLSKLCRELDLGMSPHGLRSSLRSWAAEQGVPRDLAEMLLGHAVGGVEGSYQRSDLLQRRRGVLEDWAKYLKITR